MNKDLINVVKGTRLVFKDHYEITVEKANENSVIGVSDKGIASIFRWEELEPIKPIPETMSCALCGYFCNNYHHHNNWFDTAAAPTPSPSKEAEVRATLTAEEMFEKWRDIYHSGSGHGNAIDHHIKSMKEFAKQECMELLKFLRKRTDTPVTDYLGLRAKYGKDILDNEDILNEYLQSRS